MRYPVALYPSVALVVTRFEPAPAYQIRRLRKHRHVSPGLRNYRCGRAFFNSGDCLKTSVLFGKVFLAHGSECFLTLVYLSVYQAYHRQILPDYDDIGW